MLPPQPQIAQVGYMNGFMSLKRLDRQFYCPGRKYIFGPKLRERQKWFFFKKLPHDRLRSKLWHTTLQPNRFPVFFPPCVLRPAMRTVHDSLISPLTPYFCMPFYQIILVIKNILSFFILFLFREPIISLCSIRQDEQN